jgi:hypothetical protein
LGDWSHRLGPKPRGVDSLLVGPKITAWEVRPWAAEEAGTTEAPRGGAAVGDEEQEEPGAVARDARTREAPVQAAMTKRGTGRRSTSVSTGWPSAWSGSRKRCASCAAAATAGVPGALRNRWRGVEAPTPLLLSFARVVRGREAPRTSPLRVSKKFARWRQLAPPLRRAASAWRGPASGPPPMPG